MFNVGIVLLIKFMEIVSGGDTHSDAVQQIDKIFIVLAIDLLQFNNARLVVPEYVRAEKIGCLICIFIEVRLIIGSYYGRELKNVSYKDELFPTEGQIAGHVESKRLINGVHQIDPYH